jgi:hypothetical protein
LQHPFFAMAEPLRSLAPMIKAARETAQNKWSIWLPRIPFPILFRSLGCYSSLFLFHTCSSVLPPMDLLYLRISPRLFFDLHCRVLDIISVMHTTRLNTYACVPRRLLTTVDTRKKIEHQLYSTLFSFDSFTWIDGRACGAELSGPESSAVFELTCNTIYMGWLWMYL